MKWLAVLALPLALLALVVACEEEEEEAAVATPSPTATATPTRTAAPTATETRVPSPTAAATPTVVAVPPQPGGFADYPAAIADYLTATGGSPSCLDELLAVWDMPTTVWDMPTALEEYGAVDCAAGDLDGDGEDEYLVRLTDPVATDGMHKSEVLIIDRGVTGYEVASERARLETEGYWTQPVILGVRDFNGDGKAEASFTVFSGDAYHCCWMPVFILAWDGQEYHNVTEAYVPVPPPPRDIYFVDFEGDGIEELYVAAFDTNFTYAWDGISYVLVAEEYVGAEEYEPSAPSVDIREVDFSEIVGVPYCTYGPQGCYGIPEGFTVYGDLTGDGLEEAILPGHSGGTAGFISLWVYGYVDGELQALMDRPAPEGTAAPAYIGVPQVEDGRLVVARPAYGPDDLMSFPSQLKNEYYEWDGSDLVLVSEETIDNPYLPP
ncbi:MAG: hypothetical protein JSU97_10045 [Dehalococcoidia bacterium]|nr:MAG: hypothetical protein JSU97_10045 [Dehalococcoidia bacterium]